MYENLINYLNPIELFELIYIQHCLFFIFIISIQVITLLSYFEVQCVLARAMLVKYMYWKVKTMKVQCRLYDPRWKHLGSVFHLLLLAFWSNKNMIGYRLIIWEKAEVRIEIVGCMPINPKNTSWPIFVK